ncbi:MAG: thioredoxin family protein [Rhodospirillaceae bacterium]
MGTTTQFSDGLIAFVKHACPTCTLIEDELRQAAKAVPGFRIVSQDDPRFPAGVDAVIDDRELDVSFLHDIEATPTLISKRDGREIERVVGWDRAAWQRLTGIATLGASLPAMRPG